jgi:hypothetical protein
VQQLCAQTDVVPEQLMSLYDTCRGSTPTSAQLTEALISLLSGPPKDYLVIDALDECKEDEGDRERKMFFDALTEMKGSATGSYNIFITSRPETDIRSAMTKLSDATLEAQGPGVKDDIRLHVTAFLSNDTRMQKWPENVKVAVVKDLTEKANGM